MPKPLPDWMDGMEEVPVTRPGQFAYAVHVTDPGRVGKYQGPKPGELTDDPKAATLFRTAERAAPVCIYWKNKGCYVVLVELKLVLDNAYPFFVAEPDPADPPD